MAKPFVLFVCSRNTFRSIIAEALFNHYAKAHRAESAGMKKADTIDPAAVALLKERGIAVKKTAPVLYTFDQLTQAAKVVSFGCEGGVCLPFPSEEWEIPDPCGKSPEEQEAIVAEIERRVRKLLQQLEGA